MSPSSVRIILEAFPHLGIFQFIVQMILMLNQVLVFTEGEFPEIKYTSFLKR